MRMPVNAKQHGCRGFSLVEMLIVMAILSVVMMAVVSLYVPAHQSTVTQTQVSDLQENLGLAIRTMNKDLLTAGFLVNPSFDSDGAAGPLLPGPIYWEGDVNPDDPDDFTIRTRLVGSGFARVDSDAVAGSVAGSIRLSLGKDEMFNNFPTGSWVRLLNGVDSSELKEETVAEADRVYQVIYSVPGTIDIDPDGQLVFGDVPAETVVVRVRDNSQPAVQTIRYRLNNGALERIINGNTQIIARRVDAANSSFTYNYAASGRVNKVDIILQGQTRQLKDDVISGAKTSGLRSSVTLRNTY